jgi:dTDP-4-dehydrorhamnose reductase
MDVADGRAIEAALDCHKPWAVVNAAGYVRVADAEREPERCRRENTQGAALLARACAERGIPLVTFSSDLVFDGSLGRPYRESDPVNPRGVYGESKAEAERLVLDAHPGALVVRTSAFFGPWDRHNFVWAALQALAAGERVEAGPDRVSPTYVPDLVHATLDLLIDGATGLWHLANPGETSWRDLAAAAAVRAGLPEDAVELLAEEAPALSTALTSERGVLLPPLESALNRFSRETEVDWTARDALALAAE